MLDLITMKCTYSIDLPPKKIKIEGNFLFATTSKDSDIYCYDLTDLKLSPRIFAGHKKWITHLKIITIDLKLRLFTCSADYECRSWKIPHSSVPNDKKIQSCAVFSGHTDYVNFFVIDASKNALYTAGCDKIIKKWNLLSTNQDTNFAGIGHENWIYSLILGNEKLYSCSKDGTVREWSKKTGQCDRVFKINAPCFELSIRENLLFVIDTSTITIWNLKSSKRYSTLEGHTGKISGIFVDNDCKTILTSSKDNTIRMWEKKGKCITTFRGSLKPVNTIVVIDGIMYSGYQDGTIRKWVLPKNTQNSTATLAPRERAIIKCQAIARGFLIRQKLKKNSLLFYLFNLLSIFFLKFKINLLIYFKFLFFKKL